MDDWIDGGKVAYKSPVFDNSCCKDIKHEMDLKTVEFSNRLGRLEEKHTEAVSAIKGLVEKLESLSERFKKFMYIGVGGGGVIYFLSSGQLASIVSVLVSGQK